MIKVGDIVTIKNINSLTTHSAYTQWFERWKPTLKYEWVVHYAYNTYIMSLDIFNVLYYVLFIDTTENLALIREKGRADYRVFLVKLENLINPNQYPIKMTKEQIEQKLGYEIEIIRERSEVCKLQAEVPCDYKFEEEQDGCRDGD